ncbi:MAG: toprim domain-containing protein, partial [bacterium]
YTRRCVIAYDGDSAGRAAVLRAAPVLLGAGLDVLALDLQGAKDPDEIVQQRGVDGFLEVLGNASDVFTFGLREWAADSTALSGREKSERIELFMPLLSAVPDPVVRNDAAQRIADAFRLEFDSVWSRVRGKAQSPMARERQVHAPQASGEKFVLQAAVQGKLGLEVLGRLREELFEDPACKTLFSIMTNVLTAGNPIDFAEITTHLRGEVELALLSELLLSEEIDDPTLQRIDENLRPMERGYLNRRRIQIQRDIVEAEKAGDTGRLRELDREKTDLSRMLSTLK